MTISTLGIDKSGYTRTVFRQKPSHEDTLPSDKIPRKTDSPIGKSDAVVFRPPGPTWHKRKINLYTRTGVLVRKCIEIMIICIIMILLMIDYIIKMILHM